MMVFALVTGSILAAYAAMLKVPSLMAERRLERRLHDVGPAAPDVDATVVMQRTVGPMPIVDRLVARVGSAAWLTRLVDQSGVQTTPSAIMLSSAGAAIAGAALAVWLSKNPFVAPVAAVVGLLAPCAWLARKRSTRVAKFEEQFPDALDLMARAIKAGHAFQTALGMVADEVAAPVGPEFRQTFDQQNFGLPLREALNNLSERLPLLDVRFFVTAVTIQRESGGNLSEILENLAHVVRERFKIRRQVRTHTAHGRFTGYVLLALPAALAMALSTISPDSMQLLFREPMGQMMLVGAVVLQTIGFIWIRQVIKIEV
jgi:tight adherence protein B